MKWKEEYDMEYQNTSGNKFVEKSNFDKLFDKNYDYDSLVKHKNVNKGWKQIFDDWKEQGILN